MTDETTGALNGEPRPPQRPDPESADPETISSPPEDEVEGATPPGYDWPTHGGYLGCLMGVMAGVLLGGFLGANIFAAYFNVLNLPLVVYILLNVALFLALLIGLGRLGWWLGRRYYRYYQQPAGPTWGESDEGEEVEDAPDARDVVSDQGDERPHSATDGSLDTISESEPTEQRPA